MSDRKKCNNLIKIEIYLSCSGLMWLSMVSGTLIPHLAAGNGC